MAVVVPWFMIIWTPEIERHLAEHSITPEEFEHVVMAASVKAIEQSNSSENLTVFGRTATGREIRCIFEMIDAATILPVTAYEETEV